MGSNDGIMAPAMVNNLDAWYETGRDLGLDVITLVNIDKVPIELVILRAGNPGAGYLWVKPYHLVTPQGDVTPAQALATLGRLRKL